MQNQQDSRHTPDSGMSGIDQASDRAMDGQASLGGAPGGTGSVGSVGRVGDQTAGSHRDTAEEAKHLAGSMKDRAVSEVEGRIADRKHQAIDQLEDIAQSLRSASSQLPTDNVASRYITQAANQVDNLASFLNNNEMADLLHDVEDFARRQPAMFVGGAFALGVMSARFLKSSRRDLGPDGHGMSRGPTYGRRDATGWVEDPTRDAVSRPGAAGYAPPEERGEEGFRAPGVR